MSAKRVILAAATAAALVAPSFAQDTIRVRKAGKVEEHGGVTVSQDDIKAVKARSGPATLTFNPSDVVEIVYGKAPEAYRAGRRLFNNDDFDAAREKFDEAIVDEEDRKNYPWLLSYSLWFRAKCDEQLGRIDEATAAYAELTSKAPTSRFVPEAYAALGSMQLDAGNHDAAKAAFEKLAEVAKKEGLGGRYLAQAELGGYLVAAAKRDAAAGSSLEQFQAKVGGEHPELASEARLALGRIALDKKDFAKAEGIFQSIIKAPDVSEKAWAGGALGIADAQFEQGKYQDAVFSYSRVYALVRRDAQGDVGLKSALGWAYFRGGKAADLLAGTLPDSDPSKSTWRRRARFLYRRSLQEADGSRGAVESRKELGLAN
ncbi:MAG TPA: tetratricopeptide repeat protein [Planctomycetota bacterium]|nr:tetratricopeptide repeat protein [Planctomycetota bacterium]